GQWLIRRPHGFAGRGRRIVSSAALNDTIAAWIAASLDRFGALDVAPLVDRRGDFALHGFIARGGSVELGVPTRQLCDARGSWQGSERAPDSALEARERAALHSAAESAADALRAAGYFGPFGIDAFRWIDASDT